MKQHPGHRSGAIRALVGGALVATMGAASAAWACTPVAVFDVKELPRSDESISREVELKLTHSNPPEDGHIVIVEGNVLVDAEYREIVTQPMAKGVPVTVPALVTLTTPGYHYFSAWTTDVDKNIIRSSVRTAVHQVKPVAAANIDPGTGTVTNPPTDPLVNPPTNPLVNPARNPDANPATNPATGPGAATTPGAQPAPRPAASGATSAPVAARPAAATPAVAAVPARQDPVPATAAAAPSVPTSSLGFQAPEPSSLWSGLDAARTPSLLDSPATTGSNGGLPVGGSLMALGVLGLAGAAAIAGRRRLALARLAKQG